MAQHGFLSRYQNMRIAIGIIRTHRLRSGLLILGVAIGITTILMMVTVLSGLSRKINDDMVSANRPYVYVQKFDLLVGGDDAREQANRKELTEEDADAIERQCASVDNVCFAAEPTSPKVLYYESERTPPTSVMGSAHTFPSLWTFAIEKGRFYTEAEAHSSERVIVLGYGPASDLFENKNPIGKHVRLDGRKYKVIGTMASRDHFIGALSDNFAVMPHTTFQKDLRRDDDTISISANMRPGFDLDDGIDEITNVLRVRRGVRPGEDNDFAVMTSESFVSLIRRVTVPIGIVLTIIASIGLLVGGIGVMNIMLISVTERTREVGVRMALGATKADILQQFLVESSVLTAVGGIVGTAFGTVFAFGVSKLISFPFYFSVPWTLTAILFSGLVGVIFGLYPARRAANMDPVNALRYE